MMLASMHEDVRSASPTLQHAEWVFQNAEALSGRVRLEGSKADVLACGRCAHVAMRIHQPGRFAVWTDRELVKMVTAAWGNRDPEADSVDDRIVWPHVLVIWLGALRDGPRASSEILLDAVKVRREARHVTWLAHDPGRRCWIREQEAWADVEEHLDMHFTRLEVPRLIAPATETGPQKVATTTATSSPRTKTLIAKVRGTCIVCSKAIEKDSEFRWADGARNRAHPSCMPST